MEKIIVTLEQAILFGKLIGTLEYATINFDKMDKKRLEEFLQEIYKYSLELKNSFF